MKITYRTYHILHVEDIDGRHRAYNPRFPDYYPPLVEQLDTARRCCAKPLYAVRVRVTDPLWSPS